MSLLSASLLPPSPKKSSSGPFRTTPFPLTPTFFPSVSNQRSPLPSLASHAPATPQHPHPHPHPHPPLTKTLTPPTASSTPSSSSFAFSDFAVDDPSEEDLAASPWEGAVVYRRDASLAHLEYCTTLERLGLGRLSTGVSRSRASAMGIRIPARRAKDCEGGTPVLVSLDVTRRKRRLKLDGIVRTVITLGCNRCAEPAAEGVFSNFTLLLTEDPIEEPDEINMGTIFGQDKRRAITGSRNEEEEDDDEEIDLDDRLYFPAEEKDIDISKHIRDIVHLEITITAVCDSSCKGLCLNCGTNLNKAKCSCGKEKSQDEEYGPLKGLKKQMQQR